MIVYSGQTAVRLILNTNIDLSIYIPSEVSIEYINPNNVRGSFLAGVLSAEAGTIYFDFDSTKNFDSPGVWKLWAKIKFLDERYGIGHPIEYKVPKGL